MALANATLRRNLSQLPGTKLMIKIFTQCSSMGNVQFHPPSGITWYQCKKLHEFIAWCKGDIRSHTSKTAEINRAVSMLSEYIH